MIDYKRWKELAWVFCSVALLSLAGCGGGGSGDVQASQGSITSGVPLPAGGPGSPSSTSSPSPRPVASAFSGGHEFGVNLHTGGGSATANQQIADIMKDRNIKHGRLDTWDIAQTRDMITRIRANGGRAEVSAQINFQWDNSCNSNLALVESMAYNDMADMVHQLKDIVTDFEYLNEVTLRPEIRREVPPGTGASATAYANKPCTATLVAALRGMSRALGDIRATSGLPLRGMLGAVNRDYGFLEFALQNGVTFELVGYHIYPRLEDSLLTDTWYGAGGILTQLARFNRPIHINEFNCGEIYTSAYENQEWSPKTEACLKSANKHLNDLRTQTSANIETIHFYELFDAPNKAAPENKFGLLYDRSRAKPNLYLAAVYAGGTVTPAERHEITRRGLKTDAEIDALQQTTAASAPAAAPAPDFRP
jgi:hypothetical protein